MIKPKEVDRYAEKFRTFAEASAILNVPYFKIRRAAKSGLIPTYRLMDAKKYVKISDITQTMSS